MAGLGKSFSECVGDKDNTVTACLKALDEGRFKNNDVAASVSEAPQRDVFKDAIGFITTALETAKAQPNYNFSQYARLIKGTMDFAGEDVDKLKELKKATNDVDEVREMAGLAIGRGQINAAQHIMQSMKEMELKFYTLPADPESAAAPASAPAAKR